MSNEATDFLGRWSRWVGWWTILCFPATILAFVTWGIPATLYACGAMGFIAILGVIGLTEQSSAGLRPAERLRGIARVVAAAVTIALAVMLAGEWFGALWLALAAALVLTAPPGFRLVRLALGKVRPSPVPEEPPVTAPPAQIRVSGFSDVELCCQWRHSFWDLRLATDPDERSRLIDYRQSLLDELSSRNAAAVDAWLASGPRASDSPERFFHDDGHDQPAAA